MGSDKRIWTSRKSKNHYDDLNQEFLLHDPCPIRNEHNIHESVRYILGFMGIKIIEFEKIEKTQSVVALEVW